MKKNVLAFMLFLLMASHFQVNAQSSQEDSTYKKYYVGSTLFLLGNFSTVNNPNFFQLNVGYRLSRKDVVSVELITWKYAWPLGMNPFYNKSYGKAEEKFPGYIREFGMAFVYQRFLWKGLYTSMHIMPTMQTFVNENGKKVDKGFQLFNTNRIGYHFKLFKNRFFIEPSVGIAYRPYQTKMPDGFKQKDDKWPKFTPEPGMHIGYNF
ncbi:hypothetical protein EP331_01715 [bacterium]|nr:MAG: hypothetical protein EP331_01715 [bacterium]